MQIDAKDKSASCRTSAQPLCSLEVMHYSQLFTETGVTADQVCVWTIQLPSPLHPALRVPH